MSATLHSQWSTHRMFCQIGRSLKITNGERRREQQAFVNLKYYMSQNWQLRPEHIWKFLEKCRERADKKKEFDLL